MSERQFNIYFLIVTIIAVGVLLIAIRLDSRGRDGSWLAAIGLVGWMLALFVPAAISFIALVR